MSVARDRWEHNLAKIKRQAKFDREQKKLQESLCSFCGQVNPPNNFGCNNCGAPLDLDIKTNNFGLPEITNKK